MTDCMEERAPVAGGLLGPISAAAAAAADGNTSMIDHIRDVCSDDFYHQSLTLNYLIFIVKPIRTVTSFPSVPCIPLSRAERGSASVSGHEDLIAADYC